MPTRRTVSLLAITRSEQSPASAHRRVLACRGDQRSEARYASLCSIARIMGGLAAVRQKFHLAPMFKFAEPPLFGWRGRAFLSASPAMRCAIQKWHKANALEYGIITRTTKRQGKDQWHRRCLPTFTCTHCAFDLSHFGQNSHVTSVQLWGSTKPRSRYHSNGAPGRVARMPRSIGVGYVDSRPHLKLVSGDLSGLEGIGQDTFPAAPACRVERVSELCQLVIDD